MKKAHIVVGMQFGDEGKGTMVDTLCRHNEADLVVRYNGGSQAAHNVVTDDGKHHTFAQVGSGAFVPGVRTLLSRHMLWDPICLAHEISDLSEKLNRHALDGHFIDAEAPVITPFHRAVNCLREWARGKDRHGSCGFGVGETASDVVSYPGQVIKAHELKSGDISLLERLRQIQKRKKYELTESGFVWEEVPEDMKWFVDILQNDGESDKVHDAFTKIAAELNIISSKQARSMVKHSVPVFEGAQGVLLDEWLGFHPYTTWSTVVPTNALRILAESGFSGEVEVTGVTRSYSTRHGAGPFVTEQPGCSWAYDGEHNAKNDWQGAFRVGALDGVMLRYAVDCVRRTTNLHSLAVTHLDAFQGEEYLPICFSYVTDSGNVIERLEPHFDKDLNRQELMTRLVDSSAPHGMCGVYDVDQLLDHLQELSGVSTKFLSYGPSNSDKVLV